MGSWVYKTTANKEASAADVSFTNDSLGKFALKANTSDKIYLYRDGNENTAVTGGWVKAWNQYGSEANTTFIKNADNFYIACTTSGYYNEGGARTTNKIELYKYNKIVAKADATYRFELQLCSSTQSYWGVPILHYSTQTAESIELEIPESWKTNQTTAYVFVLGASSSATIKEVWLE